MNAELESLLGAHFGPFGYLIWLSNVNKETRNSLSLALTLYRPGMLDVSLKLVVQTLSAETQSFAGPSPPLWEKNNKNNK